MSLRRFFLITVLSTFLVACGGGGSISKGTDSGSGSGNGSGGGNNGGGTTADTWAVTLSMVNSDNQTIRNVSQAAPGTLQATLTKNTQPAANQLIQFSTELTGILNPSLGTAITNADGIATITLLPGNVAGSGRAIAQFNAPDDQVVSTNYAFTSAGDGPSPGATNFNVQVQLLNSTTNAASTTVRASEPLLVSIQATTTDGLPVTNQLVTFSSTLGRFIPANGTALTDSNGVATILFTAGSVEGAGEMTVTVSATESTVGFYTLGDEIDASQINAAIDFEFLSCPTNWDRVQRDKSQCGTTQNITASSPGVIYITMTKAGSNVPIASSLVSAETTIGRISPETATAITDANGVALLDLLAGSDVGAGEVTISAFDASTKKAFEIGAADVSLNIDNGLSNGQSLAAGATTIVTVSIDDVDGSPYLPPLNVEFSSNCASSTPARAVLDASVTSVGGIARATYRANGCVGTDTVTATVVTGGDARTINTNLNVEEALTGSIEYVSTTSNFLAIRGTGGVGRTETAIVQFRVRDENGNPDPQEFVRFSLESAVGELEIEPAEAFTNNDGLVQTVVRAGRVPEVVRVLAIHEPADGQPDNANNRISAVSDQLVVSTGLPDNNSFTLAPDVLNAEGLTIDGTEVPVTVYLADHVNNPVPDGTAVNFETEGGSIQPGCITENGRCSVNWTAQNPRPFAEQNVSGNYPYQNTISHKCDSYFGQPAPCTRGITNADGSIDTPLGGRATILATAIGEESFTDLNNNGVFDSNEYYDEFDLPEAFIDHNENGIYDGIDCGDASEPCSPLNSDGGEFEEFQDLDLNGVWTQGDNKYNGLLCSEAAQAENRCTFSTVHVRRNVELVMSGSTAYVRFRTPRSSCSDVIADDGSGRVLMALEASDEAGYCDVQSVDLSNYAGVSNTISVVPIEILFTDWFNNPLPAGTTIILTASNGVIAGELNQTQVSTNRRTPERVQITLSRETVGNTFLSGNVSVTFTTPKNNVTTHALGVTDDR